MRRIRNWWLQRNLFMGFNMALQEVDREALTEEELQMIAGKQFPSDRLTNVRDIFLFSCFTGLAYTDVKRLKQTEISTEIDGDEWDFYQAEKTDTSFRIPILPTALEILHRCEDHPVCLVKWLVYLF